MAATKPPSIMVVGGYGAFGIRAVERLLRGGDLGVIVAGRSLDKAQRAVSGLSSRAATPVTAAAIDAGVPAIDELRRCAPAVIINSSGPFQGQDYALARAAIEIGAHYVDLADARGFVTGIAALDAAAKAAGVLVTSGASSVPALAAAIIDQHLPEFARLETIEHAITPGNGYDPGQATTASILGGLGKPMPMLIEGQWQTVYGWLGLRRVEVPGLGSRWMAHCDVPDLELFPQRYPHVRTVRFAAGLDVTVFQLSLWALAGMARYGVLARPERLAPTLMAMKRGLRFLGGDAGGMLVRLAGLGHDDKPLTRTISLVARENMGPFVPTIAAVVVARKLARGEMALRGAMPCVGMLTLDEFKAEVAGLPIEISVS